MAGPLIGITCDLDLGVGREARAAGRMMHVLYDDYVHAVVEAGGVPLLLPASPRDDLQLAYGEILHGLLIPGNPADIDPGLYGEEPQPHLGAVNPRRTDFEMAMVRHALERSLPVFGICGGAQVLNVTLGGSLYQDIPSQVPKAYKHTGAPEPSHTIDIAPGTRLAAVIQMPTVRVNSLHHQAIKVPGHGLIVSATSRDGIVEAVEIPERPFVVAVQWHPERLFRADAASRRLFAAFVEAARSRAQGRAP
jgi:putative glutamine amidotransferase